VRTKVTMESHSCTNATVWCQATQNTTGSASTTTWFLPWPWHEPDAFGGTREPRRPLPPPNTLGAAVELP
jgi:hypothetical protein